MLWAPKIPRARATAHPGEKRRRPRLQVVHADWEIRRPTTIFQAVLQKWRHPFAEPQWEVEVAWERALPSEAGYRVWRIPEPSIWEDADATKDAGTAGAGVAPDLCRRHYRIDVDARLSPSQAERALVAGLAEVQLEELRTQCRGMSNRSS